MIEFLVVLVAFYFVGEPAFATLHELGHAVVPLAQGRETEVFVGGETGFVGSIGRLTITVDPVGFVRPVTFGATAAAADTDRWSVVASALAGPLASALALALAGATLLRVALPTAVGWFVLLAFAYLWFQVLFTLVPLRYPGRGAEGTDYRSDGRIALELALGEDPQLD